MSLALLFHYLLFNMFRMLIHPSSGAWDLFVELFHGLYCSGSSNTTHEITQQISLKLLRMDVLTSETRWALNNEIIKQVTSSWSLFIQLSRCNCSEVMFLCTYPWGATKRSTFANKQVHFPSAVTCSEPFCKKFNANQCRKCLFKYLTTPSGVTINRPIKARNEITAGEIRSQKL